jgi:predicted glutamine amidotransferase
MCIAILNTAGTIKQKTFKHCWDNNPDGGGLAYAINGKIKIVKELKCWKELYKQYEIIRSENPEANILLHFRIATHGKINETNCHPFLVNKSLTFIHNGMIYGKGLEQSKEFSDTYLFNQTILKRLPQTFLKNEAILKLLEEYIGFSKIIFLTGGNDWVILNEDSGYWIGDNWYSNKTFKAQPKLVYSSFPQATKNSYFDYKSKNYLSEDIGNWASESETYSPKETYCDCCNETCEGTEYVKEWNCEMCEKCIKSYIQPHKQYYD